MRYHHRKTRAYAPALLLFMGLIWACSGDTVIVCPDGRFYSNGLCCPQGTVGNDNSCLPEIPDVRFLPNDGKPRGDITQDQNDGPTTDPGNKDQASPPETGADSSTAPGGIGAMCSLDLDCLLEGVCLSWNQGYCTVQGCQGEATCPDGSTCASVGQTGACLALCDGNEGCRTDDLQFCKTIFDTAGELKGMCVGTTSFSSGLAGICSNHEECQSDLACYQGVPGGICVINGCAPDTCPQTASCVSIDGVPRCLKNCVNDDDCGGEALQRACVPKDDTMGQSANVCFVPAGDAPIGSPCTGGFLCATGFCQITATGVCSINQDIACSEASDCPGGQTCNISPAFTQGFCSTNCDFSSTTNCVNSFCAALAGDKSLCVATCAGTADPECLESAAMKCLFGLPLGASAEKYLCVPPWGPSPATSCTTDETCSPGSCLQSGELPGYCTLDCAWDGTCPFPGICVQDETGLQSTCYRSCNSPGDCPEGMQCSFPPTGSRRACIP